MDARRIADRVAAEVVAGSSDYLLKPFNELVEAGVLTDKVLNELITRKPEPVEYLRERPMPLSKKVRWKGTGYGGLGRTSLGSLWKHWKVGKKKHKWSFDGNVAERKSGRNLTTFKCLICGDTMQTLEGKSGKAFRYYP